MEMKKSFGKSCQYFADRCKSHFLLANFPAVGSNSGKHFENLAFELASRKSATFSREKANSSTRQIGRGWMFFFSRALRPFWGKDAGRAPFLSSWNFQCGYGRPANTQQRYDYEESQERRWGNTARTFNAYQARTRIDAKDGRWKSKANGWWNYFPAFFFKAASKTSALRFSARPNSRSRSRSRRIRSWI